MRGGQDSDYSHEKKNCTGSLIELQGTGGLPYQFNYRGNVYNALLLFPLLVVLGDTESHDRLCGRYNSHGSGIARLCGHCNTPRSETDNVDYDWDHILPEEVQSVIDAQDRLKGVPKTLSRFIDNLILDKAVSTLSLTLPTSNY